MVKFGEKFEKAFAYVIENEGGYVFDKNDPGGATKYGISQRAYPTLNIKALTLDEAKKIYYCDYWLRGKFEQIPDENVATQVFDFAVNLGIRASTIVLQRALCSGGIFGHGRRFTRPRDDFCDFFCRTENFACSPQI